MTTEDQKQRNRDKQARYRANPDNTIKLRYLKARYGITPAEYLNMEREQGGLCKICHKPPSGRWKRLHVDHDHATGKVRGLLCFRCNTMLGHATDNPVVLLEAVDYLAKQIEQRALGSLLEKLKAQYELQQASLQTS